MSEGPRRALLAAACGVALAAPAAAHDGPPFPLAVDAELAGRTLTLYADPDVGVGTFYFYWEPANGAADLAVRIGAQPADGRLEEAFVRAEAVEGTPYQMLAEVPFDRRGPWRLRLLAGAGDGGAAELVLDVEVTPPGSLGPIDIVWYLSPFAAVAFLWIKAMRQRRRYAAQVAAEASEPESPPR